MKPRMVYNPNWSVTAPNRNLAYGDGSDGAKTYNGATATQPSFATSQNVNSGTLSVANFHFYGTTTGTITGTLDTTDGNAAAGATGGAVIATGTLINGANTSQPGGTGVTTAVSASIGCFGVGLIGPGGGGGKSDGTQAGNGSFMLAQASGNSAGTWWRNTNAPDGLAQGGNGTSQTGLFGNNTNGVTGVGRGSGDGVNLGGGAGSQAGGIFFCCATIAFNGGTIGPASVSNGGNGAAGTAGGGGGGGGKGCMTIADIYTGTTITPTLTGGTGGNGQGGAAGGKTGTTGKSIQLVNM